MKYQMEMTEGEYIATVRMMETVALAFFKGPLKEVREVGVRKDKEREKEREVSVSVGRAVVEKSLDSDNDDADYAGRGATAYSVEWGTLDPMPAPTWLKPEEPPTAEQVGRGPVDAIRAPHEAPIPDAPVAEAKMVRMDGKRLAKGREIFNGLVVLWLDGYAVVDAPQPDCAEAVREIANGRNAYKVLAYVKAQGGLTHAVNAAMEEWQCATEKERQALVTSVAGNMTQVASILFPDLSDLYEYKNIFQSEDNDDE